MKDKIIIALARILATCMENQQVPDLSVVSAACSYGDSLTDEEVLAELEGWLLMHEGKGGAN